MTLLTGGLAERLTERQIVGREGRWEVERECTGSLAWLDWPTGWPGPACQSELTRRAGRCPACPAKHEHRDYELQTELNWTHRHRESPSHDKLRVQPSTQPPLIEDKKKKTVILMRGFSLRNAWRKCCQEAKTYIVTWYKPEIENVYKSYKGRECDHHHYGSDQWCWRQKCRGNKNYLLNPDFSHVLDL